MTNNTQCSSCKRQIYQGYSGKWYHLNLVDKSHEVKPQ